MIDKTRGLLFPLGLLVWLAYGCGRPQSKDPVDTAPADSCMQEGFGDLIDTVSARASQQYKTVQLSGIVDYDPEQVYRYNPLLTGVVKTTHFSLGDFVRRGQVLLEISSPEITELSANLREAETHLKMANRRLQSQQGLYDDGVASDRDILEALGEVNNLKSEIARLRESLQIYGGDIAHGILLVRADISGYVVEKNVVKGQQVNSGEALFVLGNLDKVWVSANVYAGNLGHVQKGLRADIHTTAWPDQVFRGKIDRLSNVFDAHERVLKAVIELDNERGQLKPGMMVSINLHIDEKERVVAIPVSAVIFDAEKYFAVQYISACRFAIKQLLPMYQDNNFYYVSEVEFPQGDRLIGKNSLLVYNKLRGR